MLCAPSSASAVIAVGPSPGCKFNPITKIMIRVRLSDPHCPADVVEKGSCFCVTESTATARVELSSLISISLLACEWTLEERLCVPTSRSAQRKIGNRIGVRFPKSLALIKRYLQSKVQCQNALPGLWQSITNRKRAKASFLFSVSQSHIE